MVGTSRGGALQGLLQGFVFISEVFFQDVEKVIGDDVLDAAGVVLGQVGVGAQADQQAGNDAVPLIDSSGALRAGIGQGELAPAPTVRYPFFCSRLTARETLGRE